jgi:cobalt-zinc-cadmium efflux system outer membrane protein
MMTRIPLIAFLLGLFLCGCAPYKYRSAPVAPPSLAASLETRNLDDPALRVWMQQAAGFEPGSWPLPEWDLNTLTLAAYYFNPGMDIARANAVVAAAGITTAAMKPNPSVGVSGGYETSTESPYLFGFNFSLPIETAGKRGYRIAEATHFSEASRLQVAQTAWAVRTQVRTAMVDLLLANKSSKTLGEQERLQSEYVDLLGARVHAGEIPLPEVTAARIDLTNLRQSLRTAEGQVESSRAALAAAIGIPLSGLNPKELNWSRVDEPPAPNALPSQRVHVEAVENRLDVRSALEQYEASQSRLQLEVARQNPDIDLGPGYAFEEGVHLISIQLATVLPLRNRNEGPIAEAEAQRKAAGAQLLATQSAVIAQTDKALAQYKAAYAALDEARRSVRQTEAQHQTTEAWFKSGEADKLATVSAQIQVVVAERARLDALHLAQLALGSLEDALEHPIDPATMPELPNKAPR